MRKLGFGIVLLAGFAIFAQGFLGQAIYYSNRCNMCGRFGMNFGFDGNSISPEITLRYYWLEWYLGAFMTANSQNLSARAEKQITNGTLTYTSEIDSYSLNLNMYFIQPQLGARIYFTPSSKTSPYIDLGAFLVIPLFSYEYTENITHYDTSGNIISTFSTTSNSKPKTALKGLYQFGGNFGIGITYSSDNYAFFGEFNARGLITGADIEYDYQSERINTILTGQHHIWQGSGTIWGIMVGGRVGVAFYF